MSPYRRLVALLWASRARVALGLALAVATLAGSVGLTTSAFLVLGGIAVGAPLATLTVPAALVRLFGVGRSLTRYAERLISHRATLDLLADLRSWLYCRLAPLAPAQLSGYRSGELLSAFVADVQELEGAYLLVIAPLAVAGLASLALAVAAARAGLAIPVALLVLAYAGALWFLQAVSRPLGEKRILLRTQLEADVVQELQGLDEALVYDPTAVGLSSVPARSEALATVQRRQVAPAALGAAAASLAAALPLWLALAAGASPVRTGAVSAVALVAGALVMTLAGDLTQQVQQALQVSPSAAAAGRRVFTLADTKPAVVEHAAGATPRAPMIARFDGVSFTYPGAAAPALDGVSLCLRPGAMVAVVGPNGSGKSTLVHLLARFRDPSTGVVAVGGADVRDLRLEELWHLLSVAEQRAHLFNDTLRGNLLVGRADATNDDLLAVLSRVRLRALVESMPAGLETRIGEQGLRLSGGERQRLAIARALLKPAPFLVLDEPTAHLDPVTARAILALAYEEARTRAVLLVTHDIAGLEAADEIVVLEAGHVAERGSFGALRTKGGPFRRMLDAQCRVLRDS